MTTTDLTAYQDRIDALCRQTGGRVSVQMELWYRLHSDPRAEWTVYVANGGDGRLFQGGTLESAVAQAEHACGFLDASPAPDAVVLP